MPKRLMTVLDGDAAELLIQLAGSPRKQGEFLSSLIRTEGQRRRTENLPAELDSLRRDMAALEQRIATLEARQ